MQHIKQLPQKYPEFKNCIYCGGTDELTNEHLFPYGLSGNSQLPNSSCKKCAKITGRFEQAVLRSTSFWPLRAYRDLKSRTKHKDAPKDIDMQITLTDQTKLHKKIPVYQAPLLISFPIFKPPTILKTAPSYPQEFLEGFKTIEFSKGNVQAHLGINNILKVEFVNDLKPVEFARMVSKIAFSYSAAEGVFHYIENPKPLADAIIDETDDIFEFFGNSADEFTKPTTPSTTNLHEVEFITYNQFLIVRVRLFSDSETPNYFVVLGKLNNLGVETFSNAERLKIFLEEIKFKQT